MSKSISAELASKFLFFEITGKEELIKEDGSSSCKLTACFDQMKINIYNFQYNFNMPIIGDIFVISEVPYCFAYDEIIYKTTIRQHRWENTLWQVNLEFVLTFQSFKNKLFYDIEVMGFELLSHTLKLHDLFSNLRGKYITVDFCSNIENTDIKKWGENYIKNFDKNYFQKSMEINFPNKGLKF